MRTRPSTPRVSAPFGTGPVRIARGTRRCGSVDLVAREFTEAFMDEWPGAVARRTEIADKVHWTFTRDGKARFHRYV